MHFKMIELAPGEPLPPLTSDGGVEPAAAGDLERHAPDRHIVALNGGTLVARCSCWWSGTAAIDGRPIGAIGHYAAANDDAAADLLARACGILAEAGCATAVGPMDGSTWRRYRFIVDRGTEPAFFLEPDNADDWPRQWTDAGFAPLATYASALNDDLSRRDARTPDTLRRLADAGVSIRTFDPVHAERELECIYALSVVAFQRNFLYTDIAKDEFMAQNRAALPAVRPELVLLAERNSELVGFMFAIPDVLQTRRGITVDTVILKTTAVHPAVAGMGLGGALVDLVQQGARRLGFKRAIHALMHEANVSQVLSGRYARPIRRYALFSRSVAGR
jgi:GNAT superfamily N-acetyltransferase